MALKALTVTNFLHCVVVAALLLACGGCGKDEPQQPAQPNVLLVVVDTLRADHLGIYGYGTAPTSPFLDQLAQESLVVDGLVGVTSWTLPSMASLYSGKLPSEHRVMRMGGPKDSTLMEPQTLAARFRQNGYATACMMSNFLLLKGKGFNEGFDLYDDQYARQPDPHRGSTAEDVAGGGIQWLSKQDGSKPWFLNLHFFDPHTSYEDHAEWEFADPAYSGWVRGGLDDEDYKLHQAKASAADRAQLAAYYDEEIRAVDEALRQVVDELKRSGQWENTLLIFTSDHGEELAERGYIGHTRTLHFEQVDLPLLVRMPQQQSVRGRRSGLLGQARLYNTILELASLPLNAKAQPSAAQWLLSNESAPPQEHAFFEVDFMPIKPDPSRRITKRGMQFANGIKFVEDLKSGDRFLYDQRNDADETRNRLMDPTYKVYLDQARKLMAAHSWY